MTVHIPFTKAKPVSLKAHPDYNERWLQHLIAEDPAFLAWVKTWKSRTWNGGNPVPDGWTFY